MLTGPILVHLWSNKMMFSSFQMPSKWQTIKKKIFSRKFLWGLIKMLTYLARVIVKVLGGDDFDDPSNSV